MVVDINLLLEKNPITKAMLKPKFGYKYLGLYNEWSFRKTNVI